MGIGETGVLFGEDGGSGWGESGSTSGDAFTAGNGDGSDHGSLGEGELSFSGVPRWGGGSEFG